MEDSIQTSPLIPDHDAPEAEALEVAINQQQPISGATPDSLHQKRLCRILDWWPGMNSCSISEEETTEALSTYQFPVPERQSNQHDYPAPEVVINQQQPTASNPSLITLTSIPKLKPEKMFKMKLKMRESKFTFMIKSEVDILDDGYTWRKYGQKSVLGSPYPRSYYKCATKSCVARKTVERSSSDHSIVEITYNGKHTHPSPHLMLPGPTSSSSSGLHEPPPIQQPAAASPAFSSVDTAAAATNLALPVPLASTPLMINSVGYISPTTRAAFEKISCIPPSVLLRDHGTTTTGTI